MAITPGTYELRSVLLNSMCVTGSGYTPVKGSNVFLYSWNDGNNRKWRLTQGSNGRWRLQNAANGLYMTLGSSTPANGVNVRQWASSTSGIQYWNVIETGETATIDGYECPIVRLGNYATTDGATWMLDVDRAMTTNNANMEINRTNSNDSQKFVLMPSALLNNSYPVPAGLGWVRSTNNNPFGTMSGQDVTDMKFGWRCPDTWVPNSSRTFERRTRRRGMSADTSTWGGWSSWGTWADIDPFMRGNYCFDMNLVDASFNIGTYKAIEYQVEVRCKTSTSHGKSASRIVRNIVDPSAIFTSDGAMEQGFAVNVSTDYTPAYYTLRSLELGGVELLSLPVEYKMLGASGSLVIPWENLSGLGGLPEAGATATARYSRGTDLFANISGGSTRSATLEITYGEESATAPTFTEAPGRLLDVTHPEGVTGAWVAYGGSVFYVQPGEGIPYPFADGARVLVTFGDGTVYNGALPTSDKMPCHAWNWDGGSFLLEVTDGFMETSRSVKANSSTFLLNSREWESVKFSDTLSGEFSAEGVLKDGLTESDKASLMELMKAHHAIYRAPTGEMVNVGITDVQYTTRNGLTRVSVGMTQVVV